VRVFTANVGVDLGYGFLKVTDGSRDFILPSVVGTGQEITYRSELTLYTAEEDNLTVELDGSEYFVGSLAVRQSGIAARSLAEDRPGDRSAQVLFATALGLIGGGQENTYHVVTGLPPGYYRSYQQALAQMILGEHHIALTHGGRRTEKALVVENVQVIPQPFGTVYDLFLDRNGNVQNGDLASARIGVIDIGFRTADFVVADRLEYIERLSSSTLTGLANAYALVADGLQREFGVTKENYELDAVISSGKLRLGGKVHDISAVRDAAFRQVAAKVITEANSVWPRHDLDVIYIAGGGGEALAPFLTEVFENAVLAPQAQAANVHGYWKLANKLFSSWQAPRTVADLRAVRPA
jgi:plasmid segregation protein ParM